VGKEPQGPYGLASVRRLLLGVARLPLLGGSAFKTLIKSLIIMFN
jgi:hypothetical protein